MSKLVPEVKIGAIEKIRGKSSIGCSNQSSAEEACPSLCLMSGYIEIPPFDEY